MYAKLNDETPQELFSDTIRDFVRMMYAQREAYPVIMNALRFVSRRSESKFNAFLKRNKIMPVVDEKYTDKVRMSVPYSLHKHFLKLYERIDKSQGAVYLTSINAVVTLVSIYDLYLSNLINCIYQTQPNRIKSSDKKFTCKEILEFASIEDFTDDVRNGIVENIMRDSHAAQFTKLEKLIKCKLTQFPNYKHFIEITEARNLFVHTGGIVSKQYIKNCEKAGYSNIKEIHEVGSMHYATPEYVAHCYNVLFETGVKLGQVVWRKVHEKDDKMLEKINTQLLSIINDLLENKDYDLAIIISDFSMRSYVKDNDNNSKNCKILSFAAAYYLKGEHDKCKEILTSHSLSDANLKHLLVYNALLENYPESCRIMELLGTEDETVENGYKHWPELTHFRNSAEFREAYKSIYKREFNYKIINEEVPYLEEEKDGKIHFFFEKGF